VSSGTYDEGSNLQDGSILSIQVQEEHLIGKNKILAQLNLSLEHIWPVQEANTSAGLARSQLNVWDLIILVTDLPLEYQVHLPDPKQQIWLNAHVVRHLRGTLHAYVFIVIT
jgi:hypothetical protein